jgi:hypothetical protein
MLIERVSNIGCEDFVNNYLKENKPVIVVDAMNSWSARHKWTPSYFETRFGDREVPVYGDLFDVVDITTLQDYIANNFNRPKNLSCSRYVRWYAKFRDVNFVWADEVFGLLKDDWGMPYFLPDCGYIIPPSLNGRTVGVERSQFPYRGIFISGRGARTRFHRDPWGTSAILCQIYGVKAISIGSSQRRDTYEDELVPGEMIFIPNDWLHQVTSLTDSISVTWTFIYKHFFDDFLHKIESNCSKRDLEVIRFFLGDALPAGSGAAEISNHIKMICCSAG